MGAASYNRGSAVITRQADERMLAASARADRVAEQDECATLRARVAFLERRLRRAEICVFFMREKIACLTDLLRKEESARLFSVKILCRLAFPREKAEEN